MGTSWGVSKALITHESNSMQEGLEREKNQLKLLLGMTNTLVSNMEPRDLLRAISVSIRQDMNCDVVGVFIPDSDQRQLRLALLDQPAGLNEPRIDALALGCDLLQVRLQFLGAALRRLELAAIGIEALADLFRAGAALAQCWQRERHQHRAANCATNGAMNGARCIAQRVGHVLAGPRVG